MKNQTRVNVRDIGLYIEQDKSSHRNGSHERTQFRYPGIILCMRPANEGRRYNVTSSLIGRAHVQNDPWIPKNCFSTKILDTLSPLASI